MRGGYTPLRPSRSASPRLLCYLWAVTKPPLPFAEPTMLAPMEGVSHAEFRALMAEKPGLGIVCTEFVRVSASPVSQEALASTVVKAPGLPLSVQVMGNDADKMAEAAGIVARAGAEVVDINLGCPMPRIVRKGVGAAMLKDRDLLRRVLVAMREATPVLLSAKIRAGFDDANDVVSIAKLVEECGVDFLIVHPRRRCDFYEGVADWRIVRVLKEALAIPVVGNGDVWYAADAIRMQMETGCDAVMIGRPAMRNPWIFEQAKALREGREPIAPSGDDLLAFIEHVRRRYVAAFGSRKEPVGRMKELLRFLLRALPDEATGPKGLSALTSQVCREQTLEGMMRLIEARLAGLPATALDLDAHGSLRLERSGSALSREVAA